MKIIVNKLLLYLTRDDKIPEELISIYKYGMNVLLEVLLCITLTTAAAILMGVGKEVLFVYLIVFMVRSYGGGFHFQSYRRCLAASCGFIITILIIHQYTIIPLEVCAVSFNISLIYIHFKGLTKEPGRTYEEEEIAHYNKQIKIIIKLIYVFGVILAAREAYQILQLLVVTVSMLAFSKMFGDIKYHNYISRRRKEAVFL